MIRGAIVGAVLVGLAMASVTAAAPVAGTATMAAVQCTTYESALLIASAQHGNTLRLACLPGEPV